MSSVAHLPLQRNAFSAGLSERMRLVLDPLLRPGSYPRLAKALGVNHETLRRMYHQGTWSTQVVMIVCEKIGVNGHWLLTGQGPQMAAQGPDWARASASAPELLRALGDQLRGTPVQTPKQAGEPPELHVLPPVLRLTTHRKA